MPVLLLSQELWTKMTDGCFIYTTVSKNVYSKNNLGRFRCSNVHINISHRDVMLDKLNKFGMGQHFHRTN
jgi:hypothetical protein